MGQRDDPFLRCWRLEINSNKCYEIRFFDRDYLKSNILFDLLEVVGKDVEKYFPQPYADEMLGIAEYYNMSVGEIVIANLAYDVTAWNTDRFKYEV